MVFNEPSSKAFFRLPSQLAALRAGQNKLQSLVLVIESLHNILPVVHVLDLINEQVTARLKVLDFRLQGSLEIQLEYRFQRGGRLFNRVAVEREIEDVPRVRALCQKIRDELSRDGAFPDPPYAKQNLDKCASQPFLNALEARPAGKTGLLRQ